MSLNGNALRRVIARHRLERPVRTIGFGLLGSRFPARARVRLLICHNPNDISWSLVYPYFHYADQFERDYGVAVRTVPVERFLAGDDCPEADVVLVQPWFTEPGARIAAAMARYRARVPGARLVFLDGYAHTDLRYGKDLYPQVDVYLRKALFRDRSLFLRPFAGDTNLTEYYSRLYGIPAEPVDWQVPPGLLDRLGLVPNFLTAPYLMHGFLGSAPEFSDRPIDLHSRIAVKGSPWYQAMRKHADEAAKALDGVRLTPPGRIPRTEFLKEMRASKLCWSPFGYGELCWRDLEAFMTGAVLIKPDMSHLETLPDLYRPGETYLPVRWDYADLGDVVRQALADPAGMRRIAEAAFEAGRRYLASAQFVRDSARDLGLAG